MRTVKRYGWKPDLPDHRDFKWILPLSTPLPPAVDLSLDPTEPPIYNQGEEGSCTANAIGALFQAELRKQGLPDFMPSRNFLYYNERAMEGDVNQDGGAQIRDGMKSIATLGICSETDWPYDPNQMATKPSADCYQKALANVVKIYQRVDQNPQSLKGCLAQGFRFVLGISIFESFESGSVASTGLVPMPGPNESCLGGHAVACVGYDDVTKMFKCRNSWGPAWGLSGFFLLPYDYVMNPGMSSDFWTARLVS